MWFFFSLCDSEVISAFHKVTSCQVNRSDVALGEKGRTNTEAQGEHLSRWQRNETSSSSNWQRERRVTTVQRCYRQQQAIRLQQFTQTHWRKGGREGGGGERGEGMGVVSLWWVISVWVTEALFNNVTVTLWRRQPVSSYRLKVDVFFCFFLLMEIQICMKFRWEGGGHIHPHTPMSQTKKIRNDW